MRFGLPLGPVFHLPPRPRVLPRPVAPQLNHVEVRVRKVHAEARQLLHRDVGLAQVRDVDAPHDGVVRREDGVGQVRGDGAVVVVQAHHERRARVPGRVAQARQAPQRRLPADDLVRLVPQLADGVPGGLADAHGGRAEVAPPQVGELAAHAPREAHPAVDLGVDGRHGLVRGGAEVVADEVARGLVDVQAVRDLVAVQGEGEAAVVGRHPCESGQY